MRGFWALPVALRLCLVTASKHTFSVNDDILAFPQFEIHYSSDYVTDDEASRILLEQATSRTSSTSRDISAAAASDSKWNGPEHDSRSFDESVSYVSISKGSDDPYLCRIPLLDSSPGSPANETSESTKVNDLERAGQRGWELLGQMKGRCVYYWAGWWTYQYCFGEGVKQFHQLPPQPGLSPFPPRVDPNTDTFMLGRIEAPVSHETAGGAPREGGQEVTSSKTSEVKSGGRLEIKGESRYLVQHLEDGTECDLTGRKRQIEVQFHCSPSTGEHISVINELAICKYLMVIQTPLLCNEVAFLPPQHDAPNPITCSPIISAEDVPIYRARRARLEIQAAGKFHNPVAASDNPTSSAPQRVGDIVIGARKHVPFGKDIEKSALIGGASKEILIGVVADSKGFQMSPAEMKKLGIKQVKQIETLKKQLDKIASDKGWRLEVVETTTGKQYRGIIGEDGQEAEHKLNGNDNEATEGSQEEYDEDRGDFEERLNKEKETFKRLKKEVEGRMDSQDDPNEAPKKPRAPKKEYRKEKTEKGNTKQQQDLMKKKRKALEDLLKGEGIDVDEVMVFFDDGEAAVEDGAGRIPDEL